MLDINLLRTNPELVKENIRKKFQDEKLVMVDEVVEMDKEYRAAIQQADTLRNQIKVASKQIGMLMGKGQKEEAEKAKEQVAVYKADLEGLAAKEDELQAEIRKRMLVIPNIIDPSVPIGKDDSQNVEIERFGDFDGLVGVVAGNKHGFHDGSFRAELSDPRIRYGTRW